jgi:hypothetical protein
MGSTVPGIDPGVRQRLTLRFGSDVKAWFDELPGLLIALAEKWRFELGSESLAAPSQVLPRRGSGLPGPALDGVDGCPATYSIARLRSCAIPRSAIPC